MAVTTGTCKVCGGSTYSVNGGWHLCQNLNCPFHYGPQESIVKVKTPEGDFGFSYDFKLPDPLPDGYEVVPDDALEGVSNG